MRIYKYLFREVVALQLAITFLLLFVFAGTKLTSSLADAALGVEAPHLVLISIAFNLPRFALEIIPPAFMISLMLVLARLYSENEITVMHACGISKRQLYGAAMLPALLTAVIVSLLSLYVAPEMRLKGNEVYDQQRRVALEGLLRPGQLVQLPEQAIQVESKADGKLINLSIVRQLEGGGQEILAAKSGDIVLEGDVDYLVLTEGHSFISQASGYTSTYFSTYRVLLNDYAETKTNFFFAVGTDSLIRGFSWQPSWGNAILLWRIHYPLLLLVIPLFAVPLSRSESRSGKFAKIIPAIVIYMLISSLMSSAHRSVAYDGQAIWLATGVWLYALIAISCVGLLEGPKLVKRYWKRARL